MLYLANELSPKLHSHLQENTLLTLHLKYTEYQETCTEQAFFFFGKFSIAISAARGCPALFTAVDRIPPFHTGEVTSQRFDSHS